MDVTGPTSIDRRNGLSYDDFERDYLYASRPVVITGVMREWRALSAWTPAFFKERFGEYRFTISPHEYGQAGATGGADEYSMSEFIDRVLASSDEHPAPYFRNRPLSQEFPSLEADIEPLPPYFEPNWLSDRYLVPYVGEVLNRGAAIELYIGGAGSRFPVLHYDGAGTHAFLMQVYGIKRFVVYAPDQERYLYPSPEKPNLSLVNSVDTPDLAKFPLFSKAVPITFDIAPGDLLFVPSHWWHTTKMLTPSITLSINTANRSNWHELVTYVARRRKNPLESMASRLYLTGAGTWRSWRDRLRTPRKGGAAPGRIASDVAANDHDRA